MENLAVLYQETNRIQESTALFLKLNELNYRLIKNSLAISSETQLLAYLHTFNESIVRFNSFSQDYSSPELTKAGFDNAVFLKGFLFENASRLARSIARTDSLTRNTYQRWQSCQRRLAKEYTKPILERRYVKEVQEEG